MVIVYGAAQDITAHKLTEEAHRQQQAFLRQVLDINPHFIFARDRNGYFTLVNEAFAKLYNSTVTDVLGKTDNDFNLNPKLVEESRPDEAHWAIQIADTGPGIPVKDQVTVLLIPEL